MALIILSLLVAALYTGGAWLYFAWWSWKRRESMRLEQFAAARREVAEHTFRLGLCFILAVGFLGLLIR